MKLVTASDFQLASCQASVFTDGGFSVPKILKQFYPKYETLFDASPTVLPVLEEAPIEIPRILLDSNSHEWKCQISPTRADIVWARTKSTQLQVSLADFFNRASPILLEYIAILGTRVARLAGITTRFCEHENPGVFLARHFCKEQWDRAPLNRPENFELHAHKKFRLSENVEVNSWVRNKTGLLSGEDSPSPILLIEQDINTPAEKLDESDFRADTIEIFFADVAREFDSILRLYFPEVR